MQQNYLMKALQIPYPSFLSLGKTFKESLKFPELAYVFFEIIN